MVTPNRGDHRNQGHAMRYGIDQVDPATLVVEVDNYDATDAMARVPAAIEAGRPAWHSDPDRGCAGMSPSVFVEIKGQANRSAAFTACGRCREDIREACLSWGITVGDFVAIIGGTDGPARRRIAQTTRT